MNFIIWTLVLSTIVALATGAPAETPNESSASATSASGQGDIRADAPPNSGSGTGAVPVSKPTASVGTFFDSIFNIPTSVLRAVNQFLNNNIKLGQPQSSKTAAGATTATAPVTSAATTESNDVQTETTPIATRASVPNAGAPANKPNGRSAFFDGIFNIPISAINSVNSLITGRKF